MAAPYTRTPQSTAVHWGREYNVNKCAKIIAFYSVWLALLWTEQMPLHTHSLTGHCTVHRWQRADCAIENTNSHLPYSSNLNTAETNSSTGLKNWPWICAWSSCCRRRGRPCEPWWCAPRRPTSRPRSLRPASGCRGPPRCSTGSCSISGKIGQKSSQGDTKCASVCWCVWFLFGGSLCWFWSYSLRAVTMGGL